MPFARRSRVQRSGRQHLAEPHHVGPERSAARRAGRGHLPRVLLDLYALHRALRPPDVAVQLDHVSAARPLVQTVHVLGHEGKIRDQALELRKGQVARVGTPPPRRACAATRTSPRRVGDRGRTPRGSRALADRSVPRARSGPREKSARRSRRRCPDPGQTTTCVRRASRRAEIKARGGSTQDSAGHGPQQVFGPVCDRHRPFLSRRHVAHRGHALREARPRPVITA